MAAREGRRVICHSSELLNGGRGIRFQVRRHGEIAPAFVIRFDDKVYAYLNRCAHRALELDWAEGEFFDAFGEHLICAAHGARFAPASGACVGGPCHGAGLVKLMVTEGNGLLCLEAGDDIHLAPSDEVV